MLEETQDEADKYIQSLIDGTPYAKAKDQEARINIACRLFGVKPEDVAAADPYLGDVIERASKRFIAEAAKWIVKNYAHVPAPLVPTLCDIAPRQMPGDGEGE